MPRVTKACGGKNSAYGGLGRVVERGVKVAEEDDRWEGVRWKQVERMNAVKKRKKNVKLFLSKILSQPRPTYRESGDPSLLVQSKLRD